MMYEGVLGARLNRPMIIDYVDRNGERARYNAMLIQVSSYTTKAGTYRVRLQGRLRDAPERRELVPFLVHRILGLVEPETGEYIEDVRGFIEQELRRVGGRMPDSWPTRDDDRLFTTDLGVAFDADGFAEGFVFGVHEAFRLALDIRYIGRRWVRGLPPLLSFSIGDVFAMPPQRGRRQWSEERLTTRARIQVQEAVEDRLDEAGAFSPGWVRVRLYTYVAGEIAQTHEFRCSQGHFLEYLRSGLMPEEAEGLRIIERAV